MLNRILLLITIALTLNFGAAAQPRTVTDYFLALPDDIYSTDLNGEKIENRTELIKFRRSLIKVEDVRNGYLRLEGPWEGWAEIALFKRSDGSYLIAHAETGCGPACDGFVRFRTYEAGKWKDVTGQTFPALSGKEAARAFNAKKPADAERADEESFPFYYLLPRIGRTIRVACNECVQDGPKDFVLFEYEWNGVKFVKK